MNQILRATNSESNSQIPRKRLKEVALLVEEMAIGQENVRKRIHVTKRLVSTVEREVIWPESAVKRKQVEVLEDVEVGSLTEAAMGTIVMTIVMGTAVMTILTVIVCVIVTTIDQAVLPIIDETTTNATALDPLFILAHVLLCTLGLDRSLLVDDHYRLVATEPEALVLIAAVEVLLEPLLLGLLLAPTVLLPAIWGQDNWEE